MNQDNPKTPQDRFKLTPNINSFPPSKPAALKPQTPSDPKSKIANLRKEVLLSLLSIQENYKNSLRQLSVAPSKFASVSSFFPSSSPQITARSETRKHDLMNYYQQITGFKTSEVENKLNKYWKVRINELLIRLREKQALVYGGEKAASTENREKGSKIEEVRKNLEEEFEEKYKKWFLKALDEKQVRSKEKLSELITIIEETQYARLKKKKKKFIEAVLKEKQNELTPEEQQQLEEKEKTLKTQVDQEIRETLESLVADLEKALRLRFEEIDKQGVECLSDRLQEEFRAWETELEQELEYKKTQERISQLKSALTEKIRQDVREKVKTQVLRTQSQVHESVHLELAQEFEEFRKKIDLETKEKISEVEEEFQENFCKQIYFIAEKEVKPIEIKIKMNYHKKLENLKESLKKEMEKKFLLQYRNLKRTVELEKISFCQFRASSNVYSKTLEKEVKAQHEMRTKEKVLLNRKSSDPSFVKYEPTTDSATKSRETEAAPLRVTVKTCESKDFVDKNKACNSFTIKMQDNEALKVISKPLPPPEFNKAVEQLPTPEVTKTGFRKMRIISPSLTEEFFASLLGNQFSAEKTQPRSVSNSRSQSIIPDKTQKKYENLLEQHFKYIRPRK